MASTKKIEEVKKIKETLSKAKSVVITDHTGITHKQLEALRKNLKKVGGSFFVIKNTLLKKAAEKTDFEDKLQNEALHGPTSILLSMDDEISPLKELVKAIKDLNVLKIKQGALTDKVLTSQEVIKLASLPNKDVLISQLLGMLKSPQTRLVYSLKGNLIKLALVLKAIQGGDSNGRRKN